MGEVSRQASWSSVLTAPGDDIVAGVRSELRREYGLSADILRFVPVGEDSWNFVADDRWWVSLRRDIRGHHPAAYGAAHAMAQRLDFIIGPEPTLDGRFVATVQGAPLVVFRNVSGIPVAELANDRETLAGEIAGLLGRLHREPLPPGIPVESFDVPFASSLRDSLEWAEGGGDDSAGPLAPKLRAELAASRSIARWILRELARQGDACRNAQLPMVVTHGDVSERNVLRSADGLVLIDWGGMAGAPAERDWFHIRRSFGSAPRGNRRAEWFYEGRWIVSELEEYASVLRRPHAGTSDDRAMWARFLFWLRRAEALFAQGSPG